MSTNSPEKLLQQYLLQKDTAAELGINISYVIDYLLHI